MIVMKNTTICKLFLLAFIGISCSKSFLQQDAEGVYIEENLQTARGINALLISAYAGLDGNVETSTIGVSIGPSNWVYGTILAGEAYKAGVNFSDQVELNAVMQYDTDPAISHISNKWNSIFDGVGRANIVLRQLPNIGSDELNDAERLQIAAEARFIRGFQHFEGKKVFGNIPFIDETVEDYKVPNTDENGNYVNIWPQIEADFLFAYEHLTPTKQQLGRVNKWAAAAYLAKAHLYQYKYAEAKTYFDLVINEGTNSQGVKYNLMDNFGDNFRVATQNNQESVFEVQHTIDASGTNGYLDALLTYPNGIAGGTNSWFFRPSQFIVNAFRTNENGLPYLDSFNEVDVTPFEGTPDDAPFTSYQSNLDPRLDHSVGRRGIPYLDWGMMTGVAFTAPPGESIQNGGAYSGKKHVFSRVEFDGGLAIRYNWYIANSLNYIPMRFADLLLMAAECEVELGNLELARTYVNRVRQRAAQSPILNLNGTDQAANYAVGMWTLPWNGVNEARAIVRFERRLELALEGHRFFDLVRWGTVEEEINQHYLPRESVRRSLIFPSGVRFITNRNEYQPIPIYAITQSVRDGAPTLRQNPGY